MEPIIAAIIISLTAGVITTSAYYRRNARIKRKMRKAPFKRIHLVQEGQVATIAGNVVYHKRHVKAPLSDREGVYYHVTVERRKSSGKNNKWVKEIDEVTCVDFILDDGDQVALIEANAIEGVLDMDKHLRSGTFNDASEKMEGFLNKYNFSSKGNFGFNKSLRYKEGVLEKHEYVVVCGKGHWEPAEEHGIEGQKKVLVIRASKDQPLYISDVEDILV